MTANPPDGLEVATRALARRDFSERGLRERLRRAGVTDADNVSPDNPTGAINGPVSYFWEVEEDAGSGRFTTILGVAEELTQRLTRLFLRDGQGRRAADGARAKFQDDPHFRDHVLFYEYFDGDTGRGLGASHQLGWTGLVAKLLQPRRPEPAG